MWLSILLSILSAVSLNAGAEKFDMRANKPFCKTVTSLVTSAHQQSAATAFCSSYLHIPGSTSTSTTTTTTVTRVNGGAPATTTVTSTSTIQIVPTCAGPGGSKNKRSEKKKQPKPKPGCFSKYTASAVLSSACSCLSIPPGTTTTVVTSTSTSTSTVGGGTVATTVTTTTTVAGAVPTVSEFRVRVSGSSADGRHLLIDSSTSGQGQAAFVVEPGDTFELNSVGQLVDAGDVAYQHDPSVEDNDIVYFDSIQSIQTVEGHPLQCSIVAVPVNSGFGCALSCTQGANSINTLGNSAGQIVWQLESTPGTGETFTLIVEPTQ